MKGLHITLCLTEDQFNAACKSLKVEADWNYSHHGTTYYFECAGENACIVAIRQWKGRTRNQVFSLIVHEAAHVWQRTKEVMGEESPGREIEAYALQNITHELFDLFDQLKKVTDNVSRTKQKRQNAGSKR